jgi:hypothetical protein
LSFFRLSKNLKIKINKTLLSALVSYRCETWSLTLKEVHTLKVFENRVLRRISGPKREKVAEGWRRRHNEKLHNLYASPNVIMVIKSRRMKWAGNVELVEKMRNSCTFCRKA